MPPEFIAGVFATLLALLALGAILSKFPLKPKETEYERMKNLFWGKVWAKNYLLTKAEKNFFDQLTVYLTHTGYAVFPQVRLADVVEVRNAGNDFYFYFNQIKAKHVDFVIADRNGKILRAIELDDSTHDAEEAQKNDMLKDVIFDICQIPLVRFRVGRTYDFNRLNILADVPSIPQMASDMEAEKALNKIERENPQTVHIPIEVLPKEDPRRWMKQEDE